MRAAAILLGAAAGVLSAGAAARELPLAQLRAPAGFRVNVFAADVPDARELARGDDGTVFVGSTQAGKVYALTDADRDGRAERTRVLARGLQLPAGVAFHDGALYASAVSRILRWDAIEQHLDAPPAPVVVVDDLPRETHHGWKFLAFGPDGKLYVPIGAPCNVCERPGYGRLLRMNADGSARENVAFGIRNTVGFTWQPGTGTLWFTDNGRDMLGDDLPSDELNRVDRPGQHFGFPYCHQGDSLDPDYGKGKRCADYAPPAGKLGAHVAPLGLRFYSGSSVPAAWRDSLLIAEHGSWNRSRKAGYAVVAARVAGGRVERIEPFLGGFLDGETVLGRPTDVLPLPDGAVLVADDMNGVVWRVAPAAP